MTCKLCGERVDERTGLCPDPICSALCDSCDGPLELLTLDAGACTKCGELNLLVDGRWYPAWYVLDMEAHLARQMEARP
jgi:hypothetical protein